MKGPSCIKYKETIALLIVSKRKFSYTKVFLFIIKVAWLSVNAESAWPQGIFISFTLTIRFLKTCTECTRKLLTGSWAPGPPPGRSIYYALRGGRGKGITAEEPGRGEEGPAEKNRGRISGYLSTKRAPPPLRKQRKPFRTVAGDPP